MKLFVLPEKQYRSFSSSPLQYGNIEDKEFISEDDHYLRYRVGYDVRIVSIVSAVIAYVSSYLIKKTEILADLFPIEKSTSLFELYKYLIDYSGPLALAITIYYFVIFNKLFDIRAYNPLRNNKYGPKNFKIPKNFNDFHPAHLRINIFIYGFIFCGMLASTLWPSLISNAITYFDDTINPNYDSALFVLVVAIFIASIHSIAAQLVVISTIFLLSLSFQAKTLKLKD